jgi:uncharacterized protein (TIGR02271 family)
MDQVYVGMTVEGTNGPIGVVESVTDDPTTGTSRIVVQRDDGEIMLLEPGTFMVAGDTLHLATLGTVASNYDPQRTQELPSIDETTRASQQVLESGGELRIPVIREEAVVHTREVEGGGVRVHKTVHQREEVIEQPTMREDVDVERVAIGRVVDRAPEVREEGDTLIIPVMEEMLVVEKRLVLKEELRITRRRSVETEQARVLLNEEQVTIEKLDERSAGDQFHSHR